MARHKTDLPFYLFHGGINCNAYDVLGAFPAKKGRGTGYRFRLWAPNAKAVSVVGEFNDFDTTASRMQISSDPEIWEVFIPKVIAGQRYRFAITTNYGGLIMRPDPYCRSSEFVDGEAFSKTTESKQYSWKDQLYLQNRLKKSDAKYRHPLNIYSVHLGSWKLDRDENFLSYKKLGEEISLYAHRMGFTHIHLLPVSEYISEPSWGYSPCFLFSPTSRYGDPEGLKAFVDSCHSRDIGVILEVPTGYFPKDDEILGAFDGESLYEDRSFEGSRTMVNFDLSKGGVQSMLLSSCIYWLSEYHIDGLKLDGVGSLLYPEYGRRGERWRPNVFANRNRDAAELLRKINTAVAEQYPGVLMISDDASPFPKVTTPVEKGGLGFDYAANTNWILDLLQYISFPEVYRGLNRDKLAYWLDYPQEERALLACDHNQLVHGKRSILARLSGDYWEQFAMLRAFWGYMLCFPGGKLQFMGSEFGQFSEWNFEKPLDWVRLNHTIHQDLQRYVKELSTLYKMQSPLWDSPSESGFEWVRATDDEYLIVFTRTDCDGNRLLVAANFSEKSHRQRELIIPFGGRYTELINSDAIHYGGKGNVNIMPIIASLDENGRYRIKMNIPPLGISILKNSERL